MGIVSNNCVFACSNPIPPMIIAKTPPTNPAMIISTFINNKTNTKINGMITITAFIPVGAVIASISCAKAGTNEKINSSESSNPLKNFLGIFIIIPPTIAN
ncbi:hypothetical protein [Enterococcus ureasiticus]|uniref:hypothetical protein n=1 Tax=Enterococcus ureasiticus TaxID=903984 RepID=UPI001112DFED